jgi:hypothetical protein
LNWNKEQKEKVGGGWDSRSLEFPPQKKEKKEKKEEVDIITKTRQIEGKWYACGMWLVISLVL